MNEKRIAPPNNPLQEKRASSNTDKSISGDVDAGVRKSAGKPQGVLACPFCKWNTSSQAAYDYHVRTYHERELAENGRRERERHPPERTSVRAYLLAHGFYLCEWSEAPCPGEENVFEKAHCPHLDKCPGRFVKQCWKCGSTEHLAEYHLSKVS